MSNRLVTEGLNALREQFKRDPETNRLLKGPVAKKAREVRKSIKRSEYQEPFNQQMLYALDPNEYSPYKDNPRDTFSSDEGHVRPFKGINKDPDYYYNVPLDAQGIYTLGTGVERRQRRYPGAPTMPTIDPVVRDKDFSADDFNKFKNHSKRRTHYDI